MAVRKHPRVNAVIRRDAPIQGKVGIVIGGGAGHEPLFLEYVGRGMADAEAHGQIFAAPAPGVVLEATLVDPRPDRLAVLQYAHTADIQPGPFSCFLLRDRFGRGCPPARR